MKLHLPVLLRKALLASFAVCSAYTMGLVASAADLTLGNEDSLTIDYADIGSIPDLENGTLRLNGDTILLLENCGEGDGKTYTLLTGVSALRDAEGNAIVLDSSNNFISHYFDTTRPGVGFWADATLALTDDGTLQLVRHHETVKAAQTITTRQTKSLVYSYYAGIGFEDITRSSSYSIAYGGAIYGGENSTIALSGNGSVEFSGNTASSNYDDAYGGAICGDNYSTISLSGNGSVTFSGNTASASSSSDPAYANGGAIYGGEDSTIVLSSNGSVEFSGNRASASSSSSAYGGAIYGAYGSTITLSGNGSVTFSGNTASSSNANAYGGAIYGDRPSTIELSGNGSVTFSRNTAFSNYDDASGGAIGGSGDITLSGNGSVTFSGNTASASSSDDAYAYGGAIDGSTIALSGNDSVTFSGNTVTASSSSNAYAYGGAIYGGGANTIRLSLNGSVEFSGNIASSSDSYAYGGAIYGAYGSTIELSGNGSVTFSGNTSSSYGASYGGAISVGWSGEYDSTIELSGNGSVEFSGNTARYGGAIYGDSYSTIELSGNGSVEFSENTSSSYGASYGGAIYGDSYSTIELSGNENVTFSENTARYGGAIYGGENSTIELSENGSVTFSGNTAGYGGAIGGSTIALSGNESVTFSGNTASDGGAIGGSTIALSGNGSVTFIGNTAYDGGAIGGGTIALSGNGSVTFSGNRASASSSYDPAYADGGAIVGSTIALSGNGSVTFIGNTVTASSSYDSAYAEGSAIYGAYGSTTELSGNGSVTFSGNTASASSSDDAYAYGGAIYGDSYSTIELSGNDSVTFSGNTASASSSDDAYAYGGAIYGYGNLNIRNNESVLFEKNAEVQNETYRLRSIYAGGSGDVISLSSAAGKSIEFRDSVYIASGSTVNLNADYTDADGLVHKQTGDIIFTGAYTEQHLNELLAADGLIRTATAEEILNSHTTVVDAMTNLYGGCLRVEDGAIYQGQGITAHEDSAATVLAKDATLNHAGYDLAFLSGTTLELVGDNVISGNVRMHAGSTLIFDMTDDPGYTTHSGGLSIDDDTSIRILLKPETWDEERGALKTIVLLESNDASLTGVTYANTMATVSGLWGYKNAEWSDGQLKVLYQHGAVNATWTNESGDGRWNHTSLNWVDDGFRFADVNGANIILGAEAAGNILLEEEIAIGNMTVRGNSSHALEYGAGAGLMMRGVLQLETGSSLTIGGGIVAASVQNDGALEVAGNLEVQQSVRGDGVLKVDASLSAAGLLLTDEKATHSIGCAVTVGGAVDIDGSLSAGGALSGTAVTVGGALSAASLTADSLQAASLRLTDSTADNRIGSSVVLNGAANVAGHLAVEGAFTAASLQTVGLEVDALMLTDSTADNRIGSSLEMSGGVDVAGSLLIDGSLRSTTVAVGGTLSVASLTADSLQAASLRLTDNTADNRIGSSVVLKGAANVAGHLAVEGAFTAASLQTAGLEAESLTLTDSTADNRIGSSLEMSGGVDVAGSLLIDGPLRGTTVAVGETLSVASLTADSLQAASLRLTDTDASNTVKEAVSVSGAVDVAGSLSAGGSLSGTAVTVGGALSAASLTADSLSAASLELTAADAANSVSGDLTVDAVSLASGASLQVGGTLTAAEVLIHGSAKVLQAGAFGAETMNFVLDRAALESLNLSGGDTGTIARANTAMVSGFTATLNGGTMPVQAAAYVYDISVNGGAVQLTADYVHDGMQVWSSGKWVGQSGWTDFYIAGYDAVNGVETVDLGGDTVQGANLFIAYEDDVRSSVVKNGKLEFEYVDMGGGQFELGENATMTTGELYGKGETLVMHRKSVLNATKLTLGTLALEGGELTVKNATINAMSGTEGTLNIESNGRVTVKSDVTLTGLENLGNLNLGKNTLTVNALVDVGGDVTAGEVAVQSRGSFMAIFDKLVADKVTVVNNIPAGRYTDDLSVGDGSAIGELVAEMLEVREGVVTLGRTDAATEQVLKALDLQDDAALVLNQRTALTVTDELSATEGAELRLKQQASVSYGDMNISNRGAATQVVVNAYDLANDSIQELSHAHVAVSGDEDRSIDYKLTNSSVENTGRGKLYLTHAENTFSSISAGTGDIAVMNQALELNLDELVVGEGVNFSAYRGETELPEQEAVVSVSQSVSFGAGAHINADLKLQSGVRVEMNGPVSMGSDLYLEHGMTLGGAMLETLTSTEQGQTVVLFSGIDTLYLCGEERTDAIALSHGISASEYFVNLISSQERSYYLVYDNELPGEGVLSIAVSGLAVPEPTSSMLGLMGLVALSMRRRRK